MSGDLLRIDVAIFGLRLTLPLPCTCKRDTDAVLVEMFREEIEVRHANFGGQRLFDL